MGTFQQVAATQHCACATSNLHGAFLELKVHSSQSSEALSLASAAALDSWRSADEHTLVRDKQLPALVSAGAEKLSYVIHVTYDRKPF